MKVCTTCRGWAYQSEIRKATVHMYPSDAQHPVMDTVAPASRAAELGEIMRRSDGTHIPQAEWPKELLATIKPPEAAG